MVTRYHRDADPEQEFEHYLKIGHINPSHLVDVDGMNQNPKGFHDTYRRRPRGDELILMQIVLDDKIYGCYGDGCYGAYDLTGFVAWRIYEGNCSDAHVVDFLEYVAQCVPDYSHLLLDNASNQKSKIVTDALLRLFPDRHTYVPGYSPRLKPIERGFSNVKRYIRKREHEGRVDPVALINEAFHYYSFAGEGSPEGAPCCWYIAVLFLILTSHCLDHVSVSVHSNGALGPVLRESSGPQRGAHEKWGKLALLSDCLTVTDCGVGSGHPSSSQERVAQEHLLELRINSSSGITSRKSSYRTYYISSAVNPRRTYLYKLRIISRIWGAQ